MLAKLQLKGGSMYSIFDDDKSATESITETVV